MVLRGGLGGGAGGGGVREVEGRGVGSPPHSRLRHPPLAGEQGLGGGCVCFSPGRRQGGGVVARGGVNAGGRGQGVGDEGGQVGLATNVLGRAQGIVVRALTVGLTVVAPVLPGVDGLSLVLESDTPTPGRVVRPPHTADHWAGKVTFRETETNCVTEILNLFNQTFN